MMKKIFLICLAVLSFQYSFSQIELPAILGNNMVLQQKSHVKLWGQAAKNSKVEITTSWNHKTYQLDADDSGKWIGKIETPTAGGPYQVTFRDSESELTLTGILIGEVWVCSGQSNMEMPMVGKKNQPILNSEEIIQNSSNSQLHLFNVKRAFKTTPQEDVKGAWEEAGPETVANFSAVAYQFGEKIQEELGVPVGIIVSSWGGTPIRAWMSEEGLKEVPGMLKIKDKAAFRQPSVLYNAMLAPITSYTIAGFLWYQGENDRRHAHLYEKALPAMARQWRKDWGDDDLPFYYVQIAPWLYTPDKGKLFSPYLREAQLKAMDHISNGAMVVTADVGSNKTIHPPNKTIVAERLANCALAQTYDKDVACYGPLYKSFKADDGQIEVRFKHNEGLYLKDSATQNFEIAGEDQVFYPAEAHIEGGKLLLKNEKVKEPVAARYGFKNYFEGNLFNEAGLPASPFRTDNWEMK